MERAARELSANDSWILIQGSACLEVVGTAMSFVSGSVGEGDFTIQEDCQKLAPVLQSIVREKLRLCLEAGDLPAYRRHLNLETVYLRGFKVEQKLNHEASATNGTDPVTTFLHRNGLAKANGRDSAGFWPLHYAAMSGDERVMEGLLAQAADPNCRTRKAEPKLGFPAQVSALDLALWYKHQDAVKLLVSARACLEGGSTPSMAMAAVTDNSEGLSLLHAAGGNPLGQNIFGVPILVAAACYGKLRAVKELLAQAQHSPRQLGMALHAAMANSGGSAELVELLIGLRADVDYQFDPRRDNFWLGRLLVAAGSLKHQLGRPSAFSVAMYHQPGQTPLMAAMQTAQHEGAAALIASGARLDLRNCRNWTAADFSRGEELPSFLQKGLQGERAECQRVASLAPRNGYVDVRGNVLLN